MHNWWLIKFPVLVAGPLFLYDIEILLFLLPKIFIHSLIGLETIFYDYIHNKKIKTLFYNIIRIGNIELLRYFLEFLI